MNSYVFPGNLNPEIQRLGAQDIPYMRTDEFSAVNLESEQILLSLAHNTGGRVIIYTGSGTGAMSGIVENYVSTKRKTVVLNGGSFGRRWADFCSYYGLPYAEFAVPFSCDPDYEALEKLIVNEGADTLLCQHHETSSGELYDMQRLADICRRHSVSLVADIVSSFLAEPFDMNALGVDIAITSTQKGLNIPPGLSIVFLSKKLEGYPFAHKGYYWDFDTNLRNLSRGQTPFSPATLIFLQLNARLRQLRGEGGEYPNIGKIRHRAEVFRRECVKYGWDMPAQTPSCAITAIQTADTAERKIFRGLIDKYSTFIMPGGRPGHYRISHMGESSDEALVKLAAQIREFELR